VSLKTVRQARPHAQWVRAKKLITDTMSVATVIITPRKMLQDDARIHSEGLYCLHPDEVRDLFERVVAVLQAVRPRVHGVTEDQESAVIDQEYRGQHLTHDEVYELLRQRRLGDLPGLQRASRREAGEKQLDA
jgi:hypothetical protein